MKIRTFDRAALRDTGELEDFFRFATRNGVRSPETCAG